MSKVLVKIEGEYEVINHLNSQFKDIEIQNVLDIEGGIIDELRDRIDELELELESKSTEVSELDDKVFRLEMDLEDLQD